MNKNTKIILISTLLGIGIYLGFSSKKESAQQNTIILDDSKYSDIGSMLSKNDIPPSESQLLTAFNSFASSQNNKDYKKTFKYIYPKIVSDMGGENEVTEKLQKTQSFYKSINIRIRDYKLVSEPNSTNQVALFNILIFVTFAQNNEEIKRFAQVAGLSLNNGKQWYFLDVNSTTKDILLKQVPQAIKEFIFYDGIIYTKNKEGKWVFRPKEEGMLISIFRFFGIID